jgi:hypothetical protein
MALLAAAFVVLSETLARERVSFLFCFDDFCGRKSGDEKIITTNFHKACLLSPASSFACRVLLHLPHCLFCC